MTPANNGTATAPAPVVKLGDLTQALIDALTVVLSPVVPRDVWLVVADDGDGLSPVQAFAERDDAEAFAEALDCPAETRRIGVTR